MRKVQEKDRAKNESIPWNEERVPNRGHVLNRKRVKVEKKKMSSVTAKRGKRKREGESKKRSGMLSIWCILSENEQIECIEISSGSKEKYDKRKHFVMLYNERWDNISTQSLSSELPLSLSAFMRSHAHINICAHSNAQTRFDIYICTMSLLKLQSSR